ncbi:hypothetical protein UFOVP783_54 [uncultured Caudovirales phage]|uniref:Uncharacterized protein n=1 Tax=uncultured Caudovirales phage TaxID=2100421 RepID=A0A6J5P009_9CAUD|nr:hypothetical protein UFOVP783_54 [uncultured Caudovirales phage]
MDPQTVNLTLSTSGVVPVSVSAYNANTLILSCDGDLSGGTFEELTAEIYQNANLGEGPLATVTYAGALGAGPHLLTFVPEQTNLLPSAPSILSRGFYLVVRGTGTGGIKTVFALGRLTLYANPASDIGAPPPAPSLYAANVFRYIAAAGSTTFSSVGRDDTLSFSVSAGANLSLNSLAKSVDFTVLGGSPWISGKQYAANTLIGSSGKAYICTAAHTSSASTQPETGGQWATVWSVIVSGGTAGDVFGPALSQDNGIAVYSGTTGKLLKASGATVTLTGAVACDAISLALAPVTALSAGVFRYDSGEQVPEVGIGSVALKLGVQRYVRAYNDTASAMTKGQAVYLSGAQGNRVAVKLASAASEATSAGTLGLVAQSIAAGAEGFVQVDGPMYGLNTLGLTAGSLLYVSSTSGVLTPTSPAAPAHGVRMGYVERVHASAGSIFIKVDNGYELGELHDVLDSITGQVGLLVKNASTGVWEALSSAAAFTAIGLDTALSNKADLVGGKLSTSQLPDLALVQYLGAAANQAAMLALVGQRGDWCTRTDDGKTYIVTAEPSSTLANWTAMSYPASPVVSVAGRTGAVTLSSGDISGLGALATLGAVGTAQITDGSVTNAELANMAAATVKGSIAGGVPEDLNPTQLTALINTFTASLSGAVPAATGGNLTTEFLRKDGTWAAPPGGGTSTAAGTGAELQFRNASTGAFAAVTNSSVSGGTITLGDAENYGATPVSLLALRNTTAATDPGVAQVTTGQQSSPAFQLEGQGWNYTGGVAASTPVRVRGYVQPQTPFGLNNATNVLFQLESQIGSGAWSRLVEFRQSPAQGFLANIGPTGGITLGGSNGNDGVFTGSVSAGVEILAIVTTAASAGTQRNSGIIRQEGQGWNGTASVPVEFRSYVRPTAGTTNPTYDYIVEARHNRGSWTQLMRIQTGETGNLFTTGSVAASFGSLYTSALDVAGIMRAGSSFAGTRIRSGDTYQWTSSATDPNVAADLSIGRRAAANLRLGAADAASAVAQTISVQSVVAGTASGTVGANLTFDGSQGTGTGAGGSIIFRVAPAGGASTAQNPLVEAIRIKGNDKGLSFWGASVNGFFYAVGTSGIAWRGDRFQLQGPGANDAGELVIGSTNSVTVRAGGLNNMHLGAADAASPVAQTISVQSATGTNASAAAAVLTLDGAQGTGTGAGGDVRVRLAPNGSTGASQNTLVEAVRFRATDLATVCAGPVVANGPVVLGSYTVASVPSVSLWVQGLIWVSDDVGGPTPAFSDGTNWRRVADLAVISIA